MAYLTTRMLAIAALAATALALGACAKKTTTTVSTPGGNVTVQQGAGGETTTYKSSEGQVTVGRGAVDAASLGLPIYPGSKPSEQSSVSVSGTAHGGGGQIVTLTTDDGFDKVYAYYKAQLPAGAEKMKVSSNGSSMATFQVGEQSAADAKTVMITEANGKVTIQLTHATK